MKRLFIIQMLLWCALVVVAQKQTFTIQGTIIDPSFNNEPLSGVNVYLKDRPGVGTASALFSDLNADRNYYVEEIGYHTSGSGDYTVDETSYMEIDENDHPGDRKSVV